MIVMNEAFPENCGVCPIRKKIGCAIARFNIGENLIPAECPFEPAEPVVPGDESCGVFRNPPEYYTVAEMICLMCTKRFIDVRPEGLLLKDMVCPGCGLKGYIIETGEYLAAENDSE